MTVICIKKMKNVNLVSISKKRKRVGRGIGSGKGKTCGRGTKGQKSRKSGNVRVDFEGGQTPNYRRFPKCGFRSIKKKEKEHKIINLEYLEKNRNIKDGDVIDFSSQKTSIKLLGKGEIKKKIIIRCNFFSRSAKEKIEKLGGKIEKNSYVDNSSI